MTRTTKPLLLGNWKMNGLASALDEIEAIGSALDGPGLDAATCVVFPPNTLIDRARARAGRRLAIGAQDCAIPRSGAHTGDVSAEMLRDAGASWIIVGHSERRTDHGERSATVRAKAEAALRASLIPIICLGETLAEREAGRAEDVIVDQIAASVGPDVDPGRIAIAYEPIWAIGTGRLPRAADIAAIHALVRRELLARFGSGGEAAAIVYGGSAKPDNAEELMAIPGVDGLLIGGASLTAQSFLALARAAVRAPHG